MFVRSFLLKALRSLRVNFLRTTVLLALPSFSTSSKVASITVPGWVINGVLAVLNGISDNSTSVHRLDEWSYGGCGNGTCRN